MNKETKLNDLYKMLDGYKRHREIIEDMIEEIYFKIDEVKGTETAKVAV